MWQKIAEFAKQIFAIMQKLQKHEEDIKEMRQDIAKMRQEVNDLTRIVERMGIELTHEHQNARRDREMQQLRLENILFRFERGLPPGDPPLNENEAE